MTRLSVLLPGRLALSTDKHAVQILAQEGQIIERTEVTHEDVGQMNFYLNYYREEMNTPGDTEPIGIILGAYKDKLVMKYALQNITNQVFVSK